MEQIRTLPGDRKNAGITDPGTARESKSAEKAAPIFCSDCEAAAVG